MAERESTTTVVCGPGDLVPRVIEIDDGAPLQEYEKVESYLSRRGVTREMISAGFLDSCETAPECRCHPCLMRRAFRQKLAEGRKGES